jgi:hypothetical protein
VIIHGPPPSAGPAILVIGGRLCGDDVPWLCARLRALLDTGYDVVCDVGAVVELEPVVLDGLARLQLTARRRGSTIRLLYARPALRDMLELAGMRDVLPCVPESAVELRREAEQRKEPLSVEERMDGGDPAA